MNQQYRYSVHKCYHLNWKCKQAYNQSQDVEKDMKKKKKKSRFLSIYLVKQNQVFKKIKISQFFIGSNKTKFSKGW